MGISTNVMLAKKKSVTVHYVIDCLVFCKTVFYVVLRIIRVVLFKALIPLFACLLASFYFILITLAM